MSLWKRSVYNVTLILLVLLSYSTASERNTNLDVPDVRDAALNPLQAAFSNELEPPLDLPRSNSHFPKRHTDNQYVQCSLAAIIRENLEAGGCHMRSNLDKIRGGRNDKRLWLNYGEVNCTVTLKQCQKSACYRIYDHTSTQKMDGDVPRARPSSVFSEFRIVSGGTLQRWDKTGVQFQPAQEEMVFQYSTHSCHDFYSYRGRVTPQLCSEDFAPISDIEQVWLQNCDYGKEDL